MADAAQKGRSRVAASGTDNQNAKLTPAMVREARRAHAEGESFHALARRFGVTRKTITSAIRRETWVHV